MFTFVQSNNYLLDFEGIVYIVSSFSLNFPKGRSGNHNSVEFCVPILWQMSLKAPQ